MSGLPPLGDVQPMGDLTCARDLGDGHCGRPATTHIFWTADTDNSLTCDEHAAEAARGWDVFDQHPADSICSMEPVVCIWSWDEPPGRCQWIVSDETFAEVQRLSFVSAVSS